MKESEYKNNMQQLFDFCNLVKMQRILNNIYGNKKHNQSVLKVEQQDNNNLINLTKKSKIVSKILSKNKQSEITITKKSQYHQSQLEINQELCQQNSKSSHKIGSNNQKIKKKSNKFQKSSKVNKTEKPISINENELKQYAYQTPYKQEDKLQESKLSLKQLIRQEQILKDIGKISQSHLNSPNKYNQSHLYKQYYRSQSASPKHIIKVKTPNLFSNTNGKQEYSTPNKQFSQLTQSNQNKQKQIDIVKHRAHLWPSHKKEDIIQVMEGQSNRKKENIMHQNNSPHQSTAKSNKNSKKSKHVKHNEIKKQSSLSLSKRRSNIKEKSAEKTVHDKDNEENDDINLNFSNEIEQEHQGSRKIPVTKPKKPHQQAEKNHNLQKSMPENQKQEGQSEKVEEFLQKQEKNKQKSKGKLNMDKLYIKSIGNKYLETILSDYIQSQQ